MDRLLVLALYNDNRVILWVMMILFLLEITGMTVVLVFTVPQQTFTSSCHILTAPPIFVGYWCVHIASAAKLQVDATHVDQVGVARIRDIPVCIDTLHSARICTGDLGCSLSSLCYSETEHGRSRSSSVRSFLPFDTPN